MLRTDKGMVELRLENDWNNLKTSTVERLIETFQQHPNYFFTEHDIHSVLYNIAEEELKLNGVLIAKTSDTHEVILVHHDACMLLIFQWLLLVALSFPKTDFDEKKEENIVLSLPGLAL